jgi:hypothetical protein
MDLFKVIVVVIALILLIVILTLIGILINTSNHIGSVYPPIINQCPDGWMTDGSNNCIIPKSNNLGTLKNYSSVPGYSLNDTTGFEEINFSDPGWSGNGMTSQCNKRLWSNTNGIVWDTISNYNQC